MVVSQVSQKVDRMGLLMAAPMVCLKAAAMAASRESY